MAPIFKQITHLAPTPNNAPEQSGHEYFLIKPDKLTTGKKPSIGTLDSTSTTSSYIGFLKFNAITLIKGKIPPGWFSVVIKPYGQSGIGPLSQSAQRDTAIRVLSSQQEDWSVEMGNSELFVISIKASLLAKHAMGVVDTKLLGNSGTFYLSPAVSSLLIDRIKHIHRVSRQSAELDLRISHLMLAICESISELALTRPLKSREILTTKVIQLIQTNQLENLDMSLLSKKLSVDERSLDRAFKGKIDITCNLFLTAYKLNLVRKDLFNSSRNFAQCVDYYGFQSTDQLYRKYVKQFDEEPPIFIESSLRPRSTLPKRQMVGL